jgi:non-ribosomal peptide synthetase component F
VSFREVLRRVREVTLGAYEHQDVPFEKLVEELSPERDLGGSPLFQVKILLENASAQNLNLPNLQVRSFQSEHSIAKLDLTLFLINAPDAIRGQLEYDTDVFTRHGAERITEQYKTLLEQICANPDLRLSQLSVVPKARVKALAADFCETLG